MYSGNADVVISLLSNGADPTAQNAYVEAVLHLTARSPARIQAEGVNVSSYGLI